MHVKRQSGSTATIRATHTIATWRNALFSVAVAQATSGDVGGARVTIRSFRNSVPYETEILADQAHIQIQRGQLAESLATAQQIPSPSHKAIAFLNIANEYAEAGDRLTAQAIAGQIHLTRENHRVLLPCELGPFDYREPRTWGIVYKAGSTFSRRLAAIQVASEVAAAAMTLSLALGEKHTVSYAILFKDFDCEVIQALARPCCRWRRSRGACLSGERGIQPESQID